MAVCRLQSKQSVSERTFITGSLSHNAVSNLLCLKQSPWGINTGWLNTLPFTLHFSQDGENTECGILKSWGTVDGSESLFRRAASCPRTFMSKIMRVGALRDDSVRLDKSGLQRGTRLKLKVSVIETLERVLQESWGAEQDLIHHFDHLSTAAETCSLTQSCNFNLIAVQWWTWLTRPAECESPMFTERERLTFSCSASEGGKVCASSKPTLMRGYITRPTRLHNVFRHRSPE